MKGYFFQSAKLTIRKVRRDHSTPDKAVRFSNLYARLLTQPVLSQKWGILYLLHQLAESGIENGGEVARNGTTHESGNERGDIHNDADDETFRDAFAGGGLPQLASQQRPPHVLPTRSSTRGQETRSREGLQPEKEGAGPLKGKDQVMKGPSEAALLRDLPFTLQGLSATNLSFSSLTTLDLPPNLPLPIISILHTLAEPSLLYRNLSTFVESRDEGLVGQSLRSATGGELRSYLGLISTLESEIRRALLEIDPVEEPGRVSKVGVTLKRCVIWTREATMGLRLISLMTEGAKSKSWKLTLQYNC